MTTHRKVERRRGADDFAYLSESGNGHLACSLGALNTRPLGTAVFHSVGTHHWDNYRMALCENLVFYDESVIEVAPKVARRLGRVCRDCLLILTTGEPANRQRYVGDPMGVAFHWTPDERAAIAQRQRDHMARLGAAGRHDATREANACRVLYRKSAVAP